MKTIACIMLANGRPEMVKRAVAAFHAQEYPEKRLLIYDTTPRDSNFHRLYQGPNVDVCDEWDTDERSNKRSIGALRNAANGHADEDLIAHFDSDDWSHPRRLTEQAELLERTGAELTGYREGVFWDSRSTSVVTSSGRLGASTARGEAWVYRASITRYVFGASMMYPRSTWERCPIPAKNTDEDLAWQLAGKFKVHTMPSSWSPIGEPHYEPRMICEIHGGNTAAAIDPGEPAQWKREPRFDEYCRRRMEL